MPFYAVVGMIVLVMLVVAQPQILFFPASSRTSRPVPRSWSRSSRAAAASCGAGDHHSEDATSA